jgi:hypothetical protein
MTGERTGSRPQPPEAVARAAPALSTADHWSKSAQLLPGDRALLPPKVTFRELDTSVGVSGPHDFSVRKSALSSLALLASTASRPASVTIANRPSVGRDGEYIGLIWVFGKSEYFSERDWTKGPINCQVICPTGTLQYAPRGELK